MPHAPCPMPHARLYLILLKTAVSIGSMYNLGETGFFVSILANELFSPHSEDFSFEAGFNPCRTQEKSLKLTPMAATYPEP